MSGSRILITEGDLKRAIDVKVSAYTLERLRDTGSHIAKSIAPLIKKEYEESSRQYLQKCRDHSQDISQAMGELEAVLATLIQSN